MFTITTLVVVLTMLFGGVGATVYAAQDSMPNDALYTVKTWTEDIQLGMTTDPEAKFGLIESYIYRRFAELDKLLANGENIPEDFQARLEKQVKSMGVAVEQMDPNTEPAQIQKRDMDMTKSPCNPEGLENDQLPDWAFTACARLQEMWNNQRRLGQTISETVTGTITGTMPGEPFNFGPGNDGDDATEPPFQDESPGPNPVCDPELEECEPVGPQYQEPQAPETSPSEPPVYSGDNEDSQKPEEPKQENYSGEGSGNQP